MGAIDRRRASEMIRRALLLAVAVFAVTAQSDAKIHRSHAARQAFVRSHPCPSTGKPRLPCRGYIIDHVIPLCAGGADAPTNMQWQTKADAAAKDKIEWRQCRALRASQ